MQREARATAAPWRSSVATLPEQREVVAALRGGGVLPGDGAVEVVETHISYVFLTTTRAYKLKKAVVLPFLDYGTRERRRRMCEEELRLNRRLAPSIYLAVRSVVPAGMRFRLAGAQDPAAVEHLVEMTRFADEDTLAARVEHDLASDADIAAVAERLARFHAQLRPVRPGSDPLTAIRRAADETFRTLHELVGEEQQPLVAAADRFTRAFLCGHGREIARRAHAGQVREGHGDLRAEHVLLDGEVQVVDCLEFDRELRTVDVGADLAFLAMDLERLGRRDLAASLVRRYTAAGGNPGPEPLVAFHAAQRAWVRAKVAELQGRTGQAHELLALGRRLAWRARGPFVLAVCGLSGSGKTTLAHELAAASGLEAISSDPVRKRLAGLRPADRARPEHYSEEFTRGTYAELGRLARAELDVGRGAIADATFRRSADRRIFLDALGDRARDVLFVECSAPLETLVERSAERARRPQRASDATPEVVREQRFDHLDEAPADRHVTLRTDRPPRAIAEDLEAWLDTRLAQRR